MANLSVGARLRAWRESQALTIRGLASRLFASATSLGEWESDEKTPRVFHVLMIAALTGIPPEAWLTDTEQEQLAQARGRSHAPTIVPPAPGAVSP